MGIAGELGRPKSGLGHHGPCPSGSRTVWCMKPVPTCAPFTEDTAATAANRAAQTLWPYKPAPGTLTRFLSIS